MVLAQRCLTEDRFKILSGQRLVQKLSEVAFYLKMVLSTLSGSFRDLRRHLYAMGEEYIMQQRCNLSLMVKKCKFTRRMGLCVQGV